MLFASEKQSLESATTLYDSLIVKIFKKDLLANAKLVLQQARLAGGNAFVACRGCCRSSPDAP